jgi:hypothetical protein
MREGRWRIIGKRKEGMVVGGWEWWWWGYGGSKGRSEFYLDTQVDGRGLMLKSPVSYFLSAPFLFLSSLELLYRQLTRRLFYSSHHLLPFKTFFCRQLFLTPVAY